MPDHDYHYVLVRSSEVAPDAIECAVFTHRSLVLKHCLEHHKVPCDQWEAYLGRFDESGTAMLNNKPYRHVGWRHELKDSTLTIHETIIRGRE